MRNTIILILIASMFVAGVAFGVYETAWGSGRCASCHDGEPFATATFSGAHASVECLACHTSGDALGRLAFGVRHLPSLVPLAADQPTRDLSVVDDSRCMECHENVYSGPVSSSGIRIDHALCTPGLDCTQCHSTTAHGRAVSWVRTYDMETCLECHVSEDLADCALCHEGRLPEDRITTGVFSVTHGPQWEQTHGMGNSATCAACHTAADCETCHGPGLPHGESFMSEHADYSTRAEAQCFSCHETRFCAGCHGLDMPHSRAFVVEHAAEAGADRVLCERCHAESDCIVCHETHVHPGGAIGTLPGGDSSR